jgi:co-chaperonin GroES (HSP10)
MFQILSNFFFFLIVGTMSAVHAWAPPPTSARCTALHAGAVKFQGGAGVGRLILDDPDDWSQVQCHYDMVLIERLPDPRRSSVSSNAATTASGLYVPPADLPKLHLGRVLSRGSGREEENGRVTPLPDEVQVGAIVIAKNPWGIGPRDEETLQGQKLSFLRSQDIAAVITGGLIVETPTATEAETESSPLQLGDTNRSSLLF